MSNLIKAVPKPCPCCGVELVGGERDNKDGAGTFFYFHPDNQCILNSICVRPHNLDAWNTRAARGASTPTVKPLVWECEAGWRWKGTPPDGFFGSVAKWVWRNQGGEYKSACSKDAFETLEDAKAAAQADYERRILSAIVEVEE